MNDDPNVVLTVNVTLPCGCTRSHSYRSFDLPGDVEKSIAFGGSILARWFAYRGEAHECQRVEAPAL